MTRIAATSDLHFDSRGFLTSPSKVQSIVEAMVSSGADAIVLAGDLGHPLSNFRRCLDLFAGSSIPVGVVAGNHDVWRDEHHDSRELWQEILPTVSRQRGCRWLERDRIVVGSTAIVGSMAWYDYSAAEPSLGFDTRFFADAKPRISNDSLWIDWEWSDPEVAAMLAHDLKRELDTLNEDDSVDRVVVVTHVPVFEQQLLRNPDNYAWSIANAYFGNLVTGSMIAGYRKVRLVVSGHLHANLDGVVLREGMPDIRATVVGSDYGKPAWVMLEV